MKLKTKRNITYLEIEVGGDFYLYMKRKKTQQVPRRTLFWYCVRGPGHHPGCASCSPLEAIASRGTFLFIFAWSVEQSLQVAIEREPTHGVAKSVPRSSPSSSPPSLSPSSSLSFMCLPSVPASSSQSSSSST